MQSTEFLAGRRRIGVRGRQGPFHLTHRARSEQRVFVGRPRANLFQQGEHPRVAVGFPRRGLGTGGRWTAPRDQPAGDEQQGGIQDSAGHAKRVRGPRHVPLSPLAGSAPPSGCESGTMAGAVLLILLQSILTTLAIEPFGRQIIFGATLLVLMLVYGRQRRLRG